jgi:hypothetical protein
MASDNPKTATPDTSSMLLHFNGNMTAALDRHRELMAKTMRTLQDEIADFVDRRLEHDRSAMARYRACADLADVLSANRAWANEFAKDYYEGSAKIGEALRSVMADAFTAPANGETRRVE